MGAMFAGGPDPSWNGSVNSDDESVSYRWSAVESSWL